MSGLIAVLVLGGTLAAVAGDWLGHKLGRKRVSLFKLRPRYSGLLGTAVAGALVGTLAGTGIWLTGVASPPEPVLVQVPVLRTRPAPPVVASRPAVIPSAKAPAMARTTSAKPAADAAGRRQAAETQAVTPEQPLASRPAPPPAPKAPALVARRGEALLLAEVSGGRTPETARKTIEQVLALCSRRGSQRGAAAGLQVPPEQIEAVVRGLQAGGAYRLQVFAARHSLPGEHLAVQMTLQTIPAQSLADLQERERLSGQRPVDASAPMTQTAVTDLPAAGYVTLPEAEIDSSVKLVWHEDPVWGGPIRLHVGPADDER